MASLYPEIMKEDFVFRKMKIMILGVAHIYQIELCIQRILVVRI